MGAFPGAPGSEGQSGRGSGEAGEGGLFPRLAESLGSEEQRPGRRLHGAEGRARGGPPGPGLEALRAAVAAVRAAGPRFARAAPSSEPTSSSTAPFSLGFRMGAVGFGPRGLVPEARVRVWSSCRLLVLSGRPGAGSPPPSAPSTLSNPRCFEYPPVGGAGGSQYFLITSCHRFCSTRAPGRSDFSPKSALTHLGRCLRCSGGFALPREVSP